MARRILVVDDERPFADALVEFFTDRGWQARAIYDANDATGTALLFAPDVILTDIKMPGKDGLAFLEELRGVGDERVVILMTAYGTLPAIWRSSRLRADGFVKKPVSMERLAAIVEGALDRKGRKTV